MLIIRRQICSRLYASVFEIKIWVRISSVVKRPEPCLLSLLNSLNVTLFALKVITFFVCEWLQLFLTHIEIDYILPTIEFILRQTVSKFHVLFSMCKDSGVLPWVGFGLENCGNRLVRLSIMALSSKHRACNLRTKVLIVVKVIRQIQLPWDHPIVSVCQLSLIPHSSRWINLLNWVFIDWT